VASSALARSVQVTIVEAEPVPFGRTLGADVGGWLTRRWRDAGVDLRTGTGVAAIRAGDAAPVAIELADGRLVEADDVLVAIGTVPRDELFHAAFAGLGDPGRGIPTDIDGRTPIDGVFAAGDVALVDRGNGTDARRLEHWTDAAGAAVRVAHAIAGATPPRSTTPYAWSDQFGIRLQVVGRTGDSLTRQVESLDADRMLVRYVDVAGTLRGVLGVGHPSDVARYRARLAA
jgi:3-phenylpropionate/trans-cinnamate dioxygenase ferredoxin reductase subunit